MKLRRISEGYCESVDAVAYEQSTWLKRGDTRVKDWASWVANATFKTDSERARALNAAESKRSGPDAKSISYFEMQSVNRMVIMRVLAENKIDVFVNPEKTLPAYLLGGASEPQVNDRPSASCCASFTALLGSPEVDVPAGFITTVYDPQYVLSPDKKKYTTVPGNVKSNLPHPLPISMMFWAGPGSDPDVIKVASAYEAATHHRVPPPEFGPVPVAQQHSKAAGDARQ